MSKEWREKLLRLATEAALAQGEVFDADSPEARDLLDLAEQAPSNADRRAEFQTRLRASLADLLAIGRWADGNPFSEDIKGKLASWPADATPEALTGWLNDGGWKQVDRGTLAERVAVAYSWDALGGRYGITIRHFRNPECTVAYSLAQTTITPEEKERFRIACNKIACKHGSIDIATPDKAIEWELTASSWHTLNDGLAWCAENPGSTAGDWLRWLASYWVLSEAAKAERELAKERERLALVLKPQGIPGKLLAMGGFDLLTPETARDDRRLTGAVRVERDDQGQIALIATGNPVAVVKHSTLARMQDKGRLPTGVSNEVTDALTETLTKTLTAAAADLRTYYGVSLFLWLARQANEQATAGCRSVTLVVPGGYSGLGALIGFKSKGAAAILKSALLALEAFAPPFLGERYNLLHEVIEHKAAGGAAGSGQQAWLEIVVGLPLLGARVNALACYKGEGYLVPLQTGQVIPLMHEQKKHKGPQVLFYMRAMDYLSRESLALVDRGGYAIDRIELERWQDAAGLPRAVLTELWERYYMPPGAGLFQLLERTESGLFVPKEPHLDAFLRESSSYRKTGRAGGKASAAKRRGEHAPKPGDVPR